MGRGHTQADAIKELLEMPQDNPTRAGLMECMVRWQASVLATHQTTRTNAQEELLMNVDQLVQKWRNEAWNQGIEKGRQKGLIEGRRQSALLVLKGRFGDEHPWENWLGRMDSPDAFDALVRLAIASEEVGDVVRWLESEVL